MGHQSYLLSGDDDDAVTLIFERHGSRSTTQYSTVLLDYLSCADVDQLKWGVGGLGVAMKSYFLAVPKYPKSIVRICCFSPHHMVIKWICFTLLVWKQPIKIYINHLWLKEMWYILCTFSDILLLFQVSTCTILPFIAFGTNERVYIKLSWHCGASPALSFDEGLSAINCALISRTTLGEQAHVQDKDEQVTKEEQPYLLGSSFDLKIQKTSNNYLQIVQKRNEQQ